MAKEFDDKEHIPYPRAYVTGPDGLVVEPAILPPT
jgi:hypothetical protein